MCKISFSLVVYMTKINYAKIAKQLKVMAESKRSTYHSHLSRTYESPRSWQLHVLTPRRAKKILQALSGYDFLHSGSTGRKDDGITPIPLYLHFFR